VLRLPDPAAGQLTELPATGVLRVRVNVGTDAADCTVLRVMVVVDLLTRLVDLRGRRTVVELADASAAAAGRLAAELAALNVRPVEGDLHVPGGVDVEVVTGTVENTTAASSRLVVAAATAADVGQPIDPVAPRLALLAVPCTEPLALDPAAVEGAAERLARWRRRVADAAESPSAPMATGHVRAAVEALEDGLDVTGAVAVVEAVLADRALPAGAVFETLAHLDRVLALDLVRDVGRPRP
jgi:hypothetical protein